MTEPPQEHSVGYRRAAKISALFFQLFAKGDYQDRPEILDQGPAVIAANHRSFYDVFLAYVICWRWGLTPRMLVRGSYFSQPVIGWMLKSTGCIAVHSGEGKAAIDDALAELNAGRSIAIMPEGRLVKAADRPTGVGEARDGVGTMALKSGLPVIAVGVAGAERVWPIGKPVPIPRRKRTNVVVRCRVLENLSGSPTEAKDTIMAALGEAVREAEAISGHGVSEIS